MKLLICGMVFLVIGNACALAQVVCAAGCTQVCFLTDQWTDMAIVQNRTRQYVQNVVPRDPFCAQNGAGTRQGLARIDFNSFPREAPTCFLSPLWVPTTVLGTAIGAGTDLVFTDCQPVGG
jgi:hypothetical protein